MIPQDKRIWIPIQGERSATACIAFQPTETWALAPVSPNRARYINTNSSLNDLLDFLSHRFIRLRLTRAKAFQTVSRFPSETHRRYAASQSNAFTLMLETWYFIYSCGWNFRFPWTRTKITIFERSRFGNAIFIQAISILPCHVFQYRNLIKRLIS